MSDLHESKRYDIKDMFNDTSRYFDNKFNRVQSWIEL